MTPKSRVEAILRHQPADRIPFTVYEDVLPRCADERELRNDGLCLIARRPSVYSVVHPNIEEAKVEFVEHGSVYVRTEMKTPFGDLSMTTCEMREEGFSWTVDRWFKRPDDYDALEFMVRDAVYVPEYDRIAEFQRVWGDDVFSIAEVSHSPMQEIIYGMMGLPIFAEEWSQRRDRVLTLYHSILDAHRRLYSVVAESPVTAVVYDGNVTEEVIGPDRFLEYYAPVYNGFKQLLHRNGKLMGVRADVETVEMAEALGSTGFDFIDGFTPEDGTGLNLAEAMTVWPDKVIWVNFPPSFFALGPDACREELRQLIREAAPGSRVVFGVAEDVLPENWPSCLAALVQVLKDEFHPPERWTNAFTPVNGI
jgi:hypothetical protein